MHRRYSLNYTALFDDIVFYRNCGTPRLVRTELGAFW